MAKDGKTIGLDAPSKGPEGDLNIHLGRQLRRRRRLLGLTQKQIAEACGVRFQQIQKYECGMSTLSASRLWRLAQALDVPLGYFFESHAAAANSLVSPGRFLAA